MNVHKLIKYIEKKAIMSTEKIINLKYDVFFINNILKEFMEYLILLLMEVKLLMGCS